MKWSLAIFFGICMAFVAIFSIQGMYSYLFPIKFEEEVTYASAEYGVDVAVIFSCINVESRFKKDAVSSKGAVGLMQVLPTTASTLSSEEVIDLTDPETNISLGTKYLSLMIARFENLETALCAYNAGPTTVSAWLADENYSDDGISLKNIPYQETKKYIEKFNRNLKYYQSKLD